eukprot:TRINITY_DN4780_c0_g1_i1.p1 TRINITY_DN4780_c0_g1~~TRINITY_DN4780_c0_g1_i1.p1  ORF type:complete len:610 (+),score=138.19 TRINITY_DN4780_c0_g1_i1:26-1831(+)
MSLPRTPRGHQRPPPLLPLAFLLCLLSVCGLFASAAHPTPPHVSSGGPSLLLFARHHVLQGSNERANTTTSTNTNAHANANTNANTHAAAIEDTEESKAIAHVTVDTPSGPVVGSTVLGGLERFRGIPFAQPPIGSLRFAPPVKASSWSEPLEALKYAPPCVQSDARLLSLSESEDCLYLNVWRPRRTRADAALPVLVWVHGGGFHNGASSIYWPEKMMRAAAEPVIFVSINYRLGALGFLALNGTADEDMNVGLQDQQMALQWVQDNVASFGGDPTRVMLFGESAGGGSGYFHLAMKASGRLFHRAILESPGPAEYPDTAQSAEDSEAFAQKCGCAQSTRADVIACLRALSPTQLRRSGKFGLTPTVGFATVPDQPIRMLANGHIHDKPLVIGVNAAEGDFFVQSAAGPPPMSDAAYEFWMEALFLGDPQLRRFVRTLYDPARQKYGNWRALSTAVGDWLLTCGAQLALNASMHIQSPVYSYVFTQRSPYAHMNVTHASELPYVYGRYQRFTEEDELTVKRVNTWWVNMAASGDPNVPTPQPDGVTWPRYQPQLLTPSVMNVRGSYSDQQGTQQLLLPFEHAHCTAWSHQYFANLPPRSP